MLSIPYKFKSPRLLEQALTHKSYDSLSNNEQLEFLGDAVIGVIMAHELYQRFRHAGEGALTRKRMNLVRDVTLATVARRIGIPEHIRLGGSFVGQEPSDRVLASTLEAIVGAAYLDKGHNAASRLVKTIMAKEIREAEDFQDYKAKLQEYLQARNLPLPVYKPASSALQGGVDDHTVACHAIVHNKPTFGIGGRRKDAEQEAAEKMLRLVESGHAANLK